MTVKTLAIGKDRRTHWVAILRVPVEATLAIRPVLAGAAK